MTAKKTATAEKPAKEAAPKGPTNAALAEAIRRLATNRNQTEEQQQEILGLLGDEPKVHAGEGF